jgi:hypothetical protein
MTKIAGDLKSSPQRGAGLGAFVRLGWMIGGTLTMLVSVMSIAAQPVWTFGWRDVVFWSAAFASIFLRYLDVVRFAGETADGRPATRVDFARYAGGLYLAASVAWFLAHSLHL